jgi:hypothetical protein
MVGGAEGACGGVRRADEGAEDADLGFEDGFDLLILLVNDFSCLPRQAQIYANWAD